LCLSVRRPSRSAKLKAEAGQFSTQAKHPLQLLFTRK
jgi:hypothetical protein